jgi:hypothetical protein
MCSAFHPGLSSVMSRTPHFGYAATCGSPLARVAEIMLTMASQMLRSPAFSVVTFANSATTAVTSWGIMTIALLPASRRFFLRKF